MKPNSDGTIASSLSSPTPSRLLPPLGIAVCLSLFGDLTLYAVLVTQLDTVGLSLGAAGIMLGINRLIRIPSNPLAGILLDRLGRRPLFILGMLLGTLSTAGYGLLRGFWPFLISRLGWGVAWTLINVSGTTMTLDVSTDSNRGRTMGIFNAWLWSGFALGPLAGSFLVDLAGFRCGMLVCAALTALGLIVAAFALPETAPVGNRRTRRNPKLSLSLPRLAKRISPRRAGALLTDNPTLLTTAGLFFIFQLTGDGVILSTISLLLQQRLGQDVGLGSLTLGVASVAGILLALRAVLAGAIGPLAGHLSDTRVGRWPLLVGCLISGTIGFVLLTLATSPAVIVLGVALGALSGGAALATLGAQVGDVTPRGRQGTLMGLYATVGDIGSMIGPFLAFALLAFVDLRWIYLLCGLTFLIGLGLVARMRKEGII